MKCGELYASGRFKWECCKSTCASANCRRFASENAPRILAVKLLAIMLVSAAVFFMLNGCASNGAATDLHLAGNGGAMFRKLTGANAITVSESTTIYGVDTPSNPQLVCHEKRGHAEQARILGDALVLLGYIDDDEVSRMAAWVAIYSIEHVQRGYAGSRFELGAREACKNVPANSTDAKSP